MTERQTEQQRLHSVLCAHKSAFCCTGELQHITSALTLDVLFCRALFAVQKNRIFNIREGSPSRSLLELSHPPLELVLSRSFLRQVPNRLYPSRSKCSFYREYQ